MELTQELTSSEREELNRLREIVKKNEQKESKKINHAQIEQETKKFVNETCYIFSEKAKKELADYYQHRIGETIEYIERDLQQLQKIASEARFQMTQEFKKLSAEAQAFTKKEYDWENVGLIEYDIETLEEMIDFFKLKQKFLQ